MESRAFETGLLSVTGKFSISSYRELAVLSNRGVGGGYGLADNGRVLRWTIPGESHVF
jgi:hypothetical protein